MRNKLPEKLNLEDWKYDFTCASTINSLISYLAEREKDTSMKYKTKPCEIEAMEYTGKNMREIMLFMKDSAREVEDDFLTSELIIKTLEGNMHASVGDFIIKGLKGEFYPCKPDIFHAKYEAI